MLLGQPQMQGRDISLASMTWLLIRRLGGRSRDVFQSHKLFGFAD